MATIKTANPGTTIAGSIGGTVYRRGPGGQVIQSAPRRIKSQHPTRLMRNRAFNRALIFCGDIKRAGYIPAWRVYARAHQAPNKLGELRTLTWRHWAIKFNTMRYFNGLEPILEPPAD